MKFLLLGGFIQQTGIVVSFLSLLFTHLKHLFCKPLKKDDDKRLQGNIFHLILCLALYLQPIYLTSGKGNVFMIILLILWFLWSIFINITSITIIIYTLRYYAIAVIGVNLIGKAIVWINYGLCESFDLIQFNNIKCINGTVF